MRTVDDLLRGLNQRYDGLPPQLKRAARFIHDNPDEAALLSMRSLADRAGVSPASMLRLVRALSFASFDDFQSVFQNRLRRTRSETFAGRARALLQRDSGAGASEMVAAIAVAEQANVATSLCPERSEALDEAACLLTRASRIAVGGVRSCFPAAYYLHYALGLFRPGVLLLTGTGGGYADDLRFLERDDVFVAISVAPYSRETVEAVGLASGRSISVVAITDGRLAPVARRAAIALVVDNDEPGHLPSPIAPVAVSHALAALVLARAGTNALSALEDRERLLGEMHAYVGPEEDLP